MDPSDLKNATTKANWLLVVWIVLLVPWFPFAALSAMAFDGGPTPMAYIFVGSVWSYPVPVAIAAIFRKRVPALALLPLVNIACFLASGFSRPI